MKPKITYIFDPICDVFIARALYTLYKFSEPDTFNVIVIDQTKNGFSKPVMDYVRPFIHLYMHPHRNLGFAKSMNEGIIHALHWKSDYICISNDDIEIINKNWLQGIWDTFARDPRIVGVCPMTPRHAGWGYGVPGYPEVLPYKTEFSQKEYDYLLNGNFTDKKDILPKTFPIDNLKNTMVDGAVYVMPYFKREVFETVGLLDERFFPGSGEDMDHMARIYQKNQRVVSTSFSWIWHWWSKSKDLFASGELEDPYYKPPDHPYWNNMSEIWPEGHDPWGKREGKLLPRVKEIFVDKI